MSSTPRFVISPVDFDRDWDELFLAYWDSWKKPLQAVGQLTFAGIGTGGLEEEASFAATKQEYLAAALANPDQDWIKIEDMDHRIIGGAAWTQIRQGSDQRAKHPMDVLGTRWLPGPGFEPGSDRHELSRELYLQMWSWRPRIMNRPHVYGQALWVLPEYRHTGVAAQFMDFFVKVVDKLGLEAYLEASSMSTSLYLKYGFVIIKYPTLVFHRDNPSPDWTRLVHDIQSHPISIMWRPKGGKYEEGKTILPWLGKPRQAKL
ncbi:uncharacterized protein F4807DRAFT_118050 [Annulohypoxylon truncatum]|uniref:uncharacterized protein n=1 Tax=Annulohypoxylon truncatum TaxID=327061 RepID=UPI002008ADBB|nr:uncharacterized protein F4807DRAFT_118050 [Annulohypoxylon truncatum]KAI1214202.1 hypothetical protein F4807DRAFT_118050 [Annulohypoxylon truncatum]